MLPGDNADNGLPEQYKLVTTALKMLSIPVYVLAGDHDMEQGNLVSQQLPLSVSIKGKRCLFIHVCGTGSGGPDFRIGKDQFGWLEQQLKEGRDHQEEILLFMHTFPSDLKEQDEQSNLNKLLKEYGVTLVDMGHTHYNEITNNGQTIFTATRSTGQIEEGPVGYSIITVHNGIVNWRFKHLADPFPFIMITIPTDYRLLINRDQFLKSEYKVSAVVFGSKGLMRVEYQTEINDWKEMALDEKHRVWLANAYPKEQPLNSLTVKATDQSGRPGQWTIQHATDQYQLPDHVKDGSDADTIDAWPENGLFGTQLVPNRNGKPS